MRVRHYLTRGAFALLLAGCASSGQHKLFQEMPCSDSLATRLRTQSVPVTNKTIILPSEDLVVVACGPRVDSIRIHAGKEHLLLESGAAVQIVPANLGASLKMYAYDEPIPDSLRQFAVTFYSHKDTLVSKGKMHMLLSSGRDSVADVLYNQRTHDSATVHLPFVVRMPALNTKLSYSYVGFSGHAVEHRAATVDGSPVSTIRATPALQFGMHRNWDGAHITVRGNYSNEQKMVSMDGAKILMPRTDPGEPLGGYGVTAHLRFKEEPWRPPNAEHALASRSAEATVGAGSIAAGVKTGAEAGLLYSFYDGAAQKQLFLRSHWNIDGLATNQYQSIDARLVQTVAITADAFIPRLQPTQRGLPRIIPYSASTTEAMFGFRPRGKTTIALTFETERAVWSSGERKSSARRNSYFVSVKHPF